jgi:peptidoglycan/LPS O-acetylase OafA/YrhL
VLNPVTWTLQVEMLAALLFVPLWWISRRSRTFFFGLVAAWTAWFLATPHPPKAAFLYMMLLGLLVGPAARLLARRLSKLTLPAALALSFVTLWLVTQYPRETAAGTWFLQSLCAGIIVTLLVASEGRVAMPWLDHPAARFLGRISYSFYLWHFPVVFVLVTLGFATIDASLWREWPNAMALALFTVSTLVTIPIAWASYRAIELPLIRVGRNLATTRADMKIRKA